MGLRDRLLEFPIVLTLPDPVSGRDFTFNTSNIMDSLRIDRADLQGDAAIVAGQYAEIARVGRACAAAAERAKTAYAQWKAKKSAAYRATKDKVTDKETEASYRNDPEYEHQAGLATYYANLAGLFEDLREAYAIKARMMAKVSESRYGQDRTDGHSQRVPSPVDGGDDSIEELEEMAARSVAESRAVVAPPPVKAPPPPPANAPAPPRGLDDTEDEDDAEDEDEDVDGDAPIAPPKKRTRAPSAAKKGKK